MQVMEVQGVDGAGHAIVETRIIIITKQELAQLVESQFLGTIESHPMAPATCIAVDNTGTVASTITGLLSAANPDILMVDMDADEGMT